MSSSTQTTANTWIRPSPTTPEPVLRVYNSLTRKKDEFKPSYGNLVTWYNCGPTVYDAAHMGHARNYVTQDILRRILEDYFGYDVHLVMNITDIDDKIILRARHQHLIANLKIQHQSLTKELVDLVVESWNEYLSKKVINGLSAADQESLKTGYASEWDGLQALIKDSTWLASATARDEKFAMHIATLTTTHRAIEKASSLLSDEKSATHTEAFGFIDATKDTLSLRLDSQLKHTVTDPTIFRELAAYWENSFMDDMSRLRVKPPTTLTRVTDYVPQITEFVQRILDNGFAYAGDDGNVWFDKAAFDGALVRGSQLKHEYAKLAPWSKGNKSLLAEGEGALTIQSSKRSPEDFALWKASKPGEPSWPSPWGNGRPGWHIECSVMASEILGDNMDIHSGGVDLLFPHHDNELAQSEAYHNSPQWVNYFLHTGHLHIEGLKMSKSLKNFITVDELLQNYTARQVRLAFLGQLWSTRMDMGESLQGEIKARETAFENFFAQVKAMVSERGTSTQNGTNPYGQDEKDLTAELHRSQHSFRVALCDSFNTPLALQILLDLVSTTNKYLKRGRNATNIGVVRHVATWTTKMLRMFGLGEGPPAEIGWGALKHGTVEGAVDRDEILMPYLHVLSAFRDEVRSKAIEKAPLTDILKLSDRLRDEVLIPLGVALDDQEDGKALVKLVDPATLQQAREEKLATAQEKERKKAASKQAEMERQLAKLEKGKISPQEMFKPPYVPEGTYGSWDEKGIPVTDGGGNELSKGKAKKVAKEWEEQTKRHEAWTIYLAEQAKEPQP